MQIGKSIKFLACLFCITSSTSIVVGNAEGADRPFIDIKTNTADELDDYYRICEGLYVDKAPGIYDDGDITLNFKITSDTANVTYFLNDSKYPSFKVLNSTSLTLPNKSKLIVDDYPLTTSVLAPERGDACWSGAYLDNIHKTGKYRLFRKQNVLTIRYVDSATGKDITKTMTYLVSDDQIDLHNIPVVSLYMDYDSWFNNEYGIYNNNTKDLYTFCNLEFYDDVYGETFTRETKIKLGGNWSKGYPQRTLNLNFNKNSKGNKNAKVSVHVFGEETQAGFPDKPLTNLSRFRLHNGGNCFEAYTGLNDAIIHKIMRGTNVATGAYRPCVAYLNGEYWGFYSLREHYSDVYFQDNYNVDKNYVSLYELQGDMHFDDGVECDKFYNETLEFLLRDFKADENLKIFENRYVDLDSLIDVMIAEAFGGNWDFVGNNNNLKMWRATKANEGESKYADGRWRFGLHDADFVFTDNVNRNFLLKDDANSYWRFPMFAKCLENAKFKQRFYDRAVELLNTRLSELNAGKIADQMVYEIRNYRPLSAYRWGQDKDGFDLYTLQQLNGTFSYFKQRQANFLQFIKDGIGL